MQQPPESLADPRAHAVLELLASHAHMQPTELQPSMRAVELGLSRLEMALALFDIEDPFDIDLPHADDAESTVGQLVQQVLRCVDGVDAGSAGAAPPKAG